MKEFPRLNRINNKIYDNKLKIAKRVEGACDTNWFKEYDNHYCNRSYCRPHATRLELEDDKGKMGFVNIRSAPTTQLSSEVSETYLLPPRDIIENPRNYVKCIANYTDYEQEINCVPYIMPEGLLNVCAQASIWICLKILENKSFNIIRSCDMPSIQNMATGVPSSDGYGLSLKSISRLLQLKQCGTFYFNSAQIPLDDKELIDTIYAYVESGLPLILGVDVSKLEWWENAPSNYHCIILIGHTMDEKGEVDSFIVHDESTYPYLTIKKNDLLKAWTMIKRDSRKKTVREAVMMAPSMVLVPFETANNYTLGLFAELKRLGLPQSTFKMRPILLSVTEQLGNYISRLFEGTTKNLIEGALKERKIFPPWIWCFFLHSSGSQRLKEHADGIVLIDATSEPKPILMSLPNITLVFSQDGKVYQIKLNENHEIIKEEIK